MVNYARGKTGFMKKALNLILSFSCFVSVNLGADIHTISNLKDITAYLATNRSQIVVFDIDNTLLRAPSDLGSDQWVSYLAKQNMANGLTYVSAWDQILPMYFHIQKYIDLIPTEPDVVGTVTEIEKVCKHTICLTARSQYLLALTCAQLAKNNLKFQVPEVDHAKLNLPGNSIYQEGVLFCGHSCKGDVLVNFLKACHYVPDEIILVDDKLYNLEAVERQLANFGVKFIGLRYAGCDHLIAGLDMVKAEQELAEFLAKYPF